MKTRADRILEFVVGPDVLDIGCAGHAVNILSPYWLHGRLRERFPRIAGLDTNAENIAAMRAAGYGDLHTGSAEDFALGRSFDTIVAGELIEHLGNPANFLQSCTRHLKPGGRVVLTTPYAFSLPYALYAFLKFPKTCQNSQHTVWFCPQTLRELAARSGFRVTHWQLEEDYELDNASWKYRIMAAALTGPTRHVVPRRLRCNNMLMVLQRG